MSLLWLSYLDKSGLELGKGGVIPPVPKTSCTNHCCNKLCCCFYGPSGWCFWSSALRGIMRSHLPVGLWSTSILGKLIWNRFLRPEKIIKKKCPFRVLGITLPETNSSPLKMMVSNRNLLFKGSIFRGYVCFREGKYQNKLSLSGFGKWVVQSTTWQ